MDNDFNKDSENKNNNYFSNTDAGAYSEYAIMDEEENNQGGAANGMQIASLVLGIIGIISSCCCTPLAIVLGGIGLAFAIIGNTRNKGNGIGIAGLVCSIIALAIGIILLVVGILMVVSGSNPYYESIMSAYE